MTESFRIAVIGQAAFGSDVLAGLIEGPHNVVGILTGPDRPGRAADPIKATALEHAVAVHQFKRLRDDEAIEAFKALNADLCVMAFVTDIVPEAILTAPVHGSIQYHPSLLPKHRGPSSINWPIIQGETKTGLTIFWPDAGLDTGPVLLQKEVVIGPDDTLGTLYFDKLFPLGVEAMLEATEMVAQGTAPKIAQDGSQATYESWCRAPEAQIDWELPIGELYNLVRGCDPSPGAGAILDGRTVQFFRTSKEEGDTGEAPGTIVGTTEEGFRVAAKGGALTVRRVQPEGAKKTSAPQWLADSGVEPGRRFGV